MSGKKQINIILGHTFGGIMSVYETLINGLKNDFNINVVTFNYDNTDPYFFEGVNKVNIGVNTPINGIRSLIFFWKFIRLSQSKNLKSFVINNPSIAILVYLTSLIIDIKYTIHLHEPISSALEKKGKIVKFLFVKILQKAISKSFTIIFISNSVALNYINYFKIKNSKIIPNPIPLEYIFKFGNSAAPKNQRITFVSVGRLTEAKGYEVLIHASKFLLDRGMNDFVVKIIGDGELRYSLQELITSSGLMNNVELLGFIKDPYELINDADCYISSSRWEGFGLTLLYAMALRKPIISSRTGGAMELISSSKSFFDINNSLELSQLMFSFILSNTYFNEMIEPNFQTVRQYDEKLIIEKFKVAFAKL